MNFFSAHDIKKKYDILSAWETFSEKHPGTSDRVTIDDKDVFSIPKQFEDWGMYLAEQRESDI